MYTNLKSVSIMLWGVFAVAALQHHQLQIRVYHQYFFVLYFVNFKAVNSSSQSNKKWIARDIPAFAVTVHM